MQLRYADTSVCGQAIGGCLLWMQFCCNAVDAPQLSFHGLCPLLPAVCDMLTLCVGVVGICPD